MEQTLLPGEMAVNKAEEIRNHTMNAIGSAVGTISFLAILIVLESMAVMPSQKSNTTSALSENVGVIILSGASVLTSVATTFFAYKAKKASDVISSLKDPLTAIGGTPPRTFY